jgi:NADPH2:quinone reductase
MTDYRLVAGRFGGSDAIERRDFAPEPPAPGEARIRHTAIGVNFIDIYHRQGLYPQNLPASLGVEAAGRVEAIGDGVDGLRIGQRVGYLAPTPGSYATSRTVAAELLIPLPDSIDDDLAAASLLKGWTAEMLILRCAKIEAGQYALVHAAAGGVGVILVQWLAALGVHVIAHAGSAEKAAIARDAGAELSLHCSYDVLAAHVREHTHGVGVDVSFDGVGAASWASSLASLRKRGLMISFGNASGPVPPIAPLDLGRAGSLFLTRPTVYDYLVTREDRHIAAERLFGAFQSGHIRVDIGQRFALADAAKAHDALEGRRTTGSTILTP